MLEEAVHNKEMARERLVELEDVKLDIAKLQDQVKADSFGRNMENSEVERLRRETSNLEKLLRDLRADLEEKHKKAREAGQGAEYEDWDDEKIGFEIQLQREQHRIDAIDSEMQRNVSKYANEVHHLRQVLAEKKQTLSNMDVRPEDKIRLP